MRGMRVLMQLRVLLLRGVQLLRQLVGWRLLHWQLMLLLNWGRRASQKHRLDRGGRRGDWYQGLMRPCVSMIQIVARWGVL